MSEEKKQKKQKKLGKNINYKTKTVDLTVDGELMSFSFNDLPEEIQGKLGPFGLGHKLGDAAAGKKGQDAKDAIQKVYNGLKDNDWTVNAPAGPKVSVKSLAENISKLDAANQEAARALLTSLGVKIPGLNA